MPLLEQLWYGHGVAMPNIVKIILSKMNHAEILDTDCIDFTDKSTLNQCPKKAKSDFSDNLLVS